MRADCERTVGKGVQTSPPRNLFCRPSTRMVTVRVENLGKIPSYLMHIPTDAVEGAPGDVAIDNEGHRAASGKREKLSSLRQCARMQLSNRLAVDTDTGDCRDLVHHSHRKKRNKLHRQTAYP
jgi:hypothetical protein